MNWISDPRIFIRVNTPKNAFAKAIQEHVHVLLKDPVANRVDTPFRLEERVHEFAIENEHRFPRCKWNDFKTSCSEPKTIGKIKCPGLFKLEHRRDNIISTITVSYHNQEKDPAVGTAALIEEEQ